MKINWITTFLAVFISLLVTYGFYMFMPIEKNTMLHNVTTSVTLIFFLMTFVLSIGVSFQAGRTTTVVRTTSFVFLFLGGFLITLLSLFNKSIPLLIIIMGAVILVYILILYALINAE